MSGNYCPTFYCAFCVGESLFHYVIEVDARGFGDAAKKLHRVAERVFQEDIHIVTISLIPLL